MKLQSKKRRWRVVLITLRHRSGRSAASNKRSSSNAKLPESPNLQKTLVRQWLAEKKPLGLKYQIKKRFRVNLELPPRLNFRDDYELTALYMNAIRRLASRSVVESRKGYKLGLVDFDNLESISTSASLVLTAELSRWDDHIANNLRAADTATWKPEVVSQLIDVGFFELFPSCQEITESSKKGRESETKVIKYIKGRFGDFDKHRELKSKIMEKIQGREPPKWTFLATAITEAITNVGHHAYPENSTFNDEDKNWYMGGSFNERTKELRIVFYDQGISIPKSLPNSTIREKALDVVRRLTGSERISGHHDEILLRAAVEIDRTSTGADDRGKGLSDLLNFIEQRGEGYISILSRKALYKLTYTDGKKRIKTERFKNVVEGTLIIWKVTLDDSFR